MNLHYGVKPSLAALLSGALLSVSLSDHSCAGQDLRYLSFHPVPLSPQADLRAPDGTTSTSATYTLRPTLIDPGAREADYRDAIATLSRAQGPFALPLGEHLLGLGQLLQQQGKLDAALEAYESSRHVLRVNLGLDSLEQAPVLKAMFSAYAAKGDVENAHAMQEALFNLRLRHHGRDNPDAVSALLEWADWNVNLYLLLDPLPGTDASMRIFNRFSDPRLELAYDTYAKALQSLQEHSEPGDERLVTTERKLAALNFITTQKIRETYGDTLQSYSTPPDDFDNGDNPLEVARAARFYDGSSALRRAIAHSERRPQRRNDDIAARMVELGDWYLLFDHRAAAMDIYRDALRFMRSASLPPEEVERIMSSGMPVPTPDTAYLAPVDASEFDGFIDVEFELSQFGMASDPHIIGSSQENRQIERELLREIRDCKFRPKFVADAPVNSEKIQLRYYYSL
jgi:tetratricopeptide (TPR) repeat protein